MQKLTEFSSKNGNAVLLRTDNIAAIQVISSDTFVFLSNDSYVLNEPVEKVLTNATSDLIELTESDGRMSYINPKRVNSIEPCFNGFQCQIKFGIESIYVRMKSSEAAEKLGLL